MQDAVVVALAAERAALLGFLGRVEGEDWSRPATGAGWSVKDVLAHLVEQELLFGRLYRGEVRTLGEPDPAAGIAKWSALPGVAVRAAFWQHGAATQRVLDAMAGDAWGAHVDAFGCRTVDEVARLHLVRLAVSGHDITTALGAPAVWNERLAVVAEAALAAASAALRARGVEPDPPVDVIVDGRRHALGSGARTADPAVVEHALEVEAEDLVLALTARRDVSEVVARATVSGARDAVRAALEAARIP